MSNPINDSKEGEKVEQNNVPKMPDGNVNDDVKPVANEPITNEPIADQPTRRLSYSEEIKRLGLRENPPDPWHCLCCVCCMEACFSSGRARPSSTKYEPNEYDVSWGTHVMHSFMGIKYKYKDDDTREKW